MTVLREMDIIMPRKALLNLHLLCIFGYTHPIENNFHPNTIVIGTSKEITSSVSHQNIARKGSRMGVMSVTSETAFNHPAEVVYDFASNPNNWGRTYKGSGGMADENETKHFPLKVGDVWTEKVTLGENTYHSTWTLITAVRPRKWVFQQINGIGKLPDGTGGVDGITTISYTFESPGQGVTLFTRNLTCELPKGVDCPDDLLTVMARPGGIDRYHAAIQKELDEAAAKS